MNVIDEQNYAVRPLSAKVNFGWFKEAYAIFKQDAGRWEWLVFLFGLFGRVISLLISVAFPRVSPMGVALNVFTQINYPSSEANLLSGVFYAFYFPLEVASLSYLALQAARGHRMSGFSAFAGVKNYLPILLLWWVLSLASTAGVLLFVIGVFLPWALLLPAVTLIADGYTVSDAISRSVAVMKQDWLRALGFVIVYSLMTLATIFSCGLALFITVPMGFIISALAYRDLIGIPDMAASITAEAPPVAGQWPPPPTFGASNGATNGATTDEPYAAPSEKAPLHPDFNE